MLLTDQQFAWKCRKFNKLSSFIAFNAYLHTCKLQLPHVLTLNKQQQLSSSTQAFDNSHIRHILAFFSSSLRNNEFLSLIKINPLASCQQYSPEWVAISTYSHAEMQFPQAHISYNQINKPLFCTSPMTGEEH